VSDKNNLKDKIKKKNATQTFFSQYEDIKENNEISEENIINDNVNNDNNTQVSPSTKNEEDYLRLLAQGHKPKKRKEKKVFTSFYMDPDLAEQVDKIARNGVKGDKSKLINIGIRKLLQEYGVL